MRIISNLIFGQPSYDNNPGVYGGQQYSTPWPLHTMIAIGLIDPNDHSPILDLKTPINRNLAIKELVAVPTKIATQIKKNIPSGKKIAQQITQQIKFIRETRGVIDGVVDDISQQTAEYPAYVINKDDFFNLLEPFGSILINYPINNVLNRLSQDQSIDELDISQSSLDEIDNILEISGVEQKLLPNWNTIITDIGNDAEQRAFSATEYQLLRYHVQNATQKAIHQYIDIIIQDCVGDSKHSVKYDMNIALAAQSILFNAENAINTGKLITPKQVCDQVAQAMPL